MAQFEPLDEIQKHSNLKFTGHPPHSSTAPNLRFGARSAIQTPRTQNEVARIRLVQRENPGLVRIVGVFPDVFDRIDEVIQLDRLTKFVPG
jgi:hypothetical protein